MESLADLLKRLSGGAIAAEAEKKRREILQHPLVAELRSKYPQLDDSVLNIHVNRLHQYITEAAACASCPGLERCPNDFPGHYTKLSVAEFNGLVQIVDQKAACTLQQLKQSQDAIRKRIRSFYVDEQALITAYSATDILQIDEKRQRAVKRILDYILQTKQEGLQKRGLYLAGPFGTGKTFLMCYLLHELAKSGYTGVIVYMPDFMEDLKSMFQEPAKLKETVELLKETDLLVFDDIGAENLNSWARDHVMGTILNYRMNRKPTFFTSNYSLDDLEKHFSFTSKDGEEEHKGKRLMDRIRPFVEVVVINGFNKRGMMDG
jgi:primosomal protein DnaI